MYIGTCEYRLQDLQRGVCCGKLLVVQGWNKKNQVLNEKKSSSIHILKNCQRIKQFNTFVRYLYLTGLLCGDSILQILT